MNYIYILYYKLLNNNMYINLIFFILWNIYCLCTTSTIMHISRPIGFWSEYPEHMEYWNSFMDNNYIPKAQNIPEGYWLATGHPGNELHQDSFHPPAYGSAMAHPDYHLQRSPTYVELDGDNFNTSQNESHYRTNDRNPYIINPEPAKAGLMASLKKKVTKFGHKLDKGTKEYIDNRNRFKAAVEEGYRTKREIKQARKLYKESAMAKISNAESIKYYTDKLKNVKLGGTGITKKKRTIY